MPNPPVKPPDPVSHPLQPVLDFLEGRGGEQGAAAKTLRRFIIDSLRKGDPTAHPAVKGLILLLNSGIKGVFRRDLEKQLLVGHLATALKQGVAEESPGDFLNQLQELAGWLEEATREDDNHNNGLLELLPRFLIGLKTLAGGEEWLEQGVETLIRRSEEAADPDYLQELGQFCEQVITTGESRLGAWQRERELFIKLVEELASHLAAAWSGAGQFDTRLSESIARIHASKDVNELQRLKDTLLREAEGLKLHTQNLNRRITDSEQQLRLARQRLEEMESELVRARDESLRDALTGIPNRRAFVVNLERELARSRRHGLELALVIFDLDHFKRVNDTYGHPIGDKVLIAVAEKAGRGLRQSDFLARYGGEEFVVILPETNLAAAVKVAEKVRLDISRLRFKSGESSWNVTSSLGVCQLAPSHSSGEELVKCADTALYRAKNNGRNRVVALAATELEESIVLGDEAP